MKITVDDGVRILFWCVAILLGFLQAWSSRMTLVNDAVSFLDMGNLIMHGQWALVINGYWNPLYAALLGLVLTIFRPSPYWEYPAVHLLVFAIFIFAMGCFDFFLREMLLLRRQREQADELRVPGWIWLTIGYVLFLWACLALIGVSETNPDMLVAAFFFLACGILVRVRRGVAGWPSFAVLGIVLGLGYLTKAIMFPISILCLGVALFVGVGSWRAVLGAAAAALVFLALTMPFITALSISKGKPTFGENGTINYFVDIGHAPLTHWQGDEARYGRLLHPTRLIVDHPATFEFTGPVGVTYPVWYDPSYWYQGPKPDYDLQAMTAVVVTNIRREIAVLMTALSGAVVASLFLLFGASGRGRFIARDIGGYWFLLVPVIATFGLYVLLHVDNRYVAPFFVVGLLALFFSVRMKPVPEGNRLFAAVALLLGLMFISPIGPGTIPKSSSTLRTFLSEPLSAERNPNAEVVAGLYGMGLQPGDPIASVDYSNCAAVTENGCEAVVLWAHLGRFRVVSEVWYSPVKPYTKDDNFWNAEPAQQERVLKALAKTGARIVASWQEPRGPDATAWQRIGVTHWYMRWLDTAPASVQRG